MRTKTRRAVATLVLFCGLCVCLGEGHINPGDVDLSFDPGSGPTMGLPSLTWRGLVLDLVPRGEVGWLVGGRFVRFDDVVRKGMVLLDGHGQVDESFDAGLEGRVLSSGEEVRVWQIIPLEDGKLLIGGDFVRVHGIERPGLARLEANGMLDPSFAQELPQHTSMVGAMAVQADGKVVITTQEKLPGQPPGLVRIQRLHPDGRLDDSLNVVAGVSASVHAIELTCDQKLLLAGALIEIDGSEYYSLVRLHPDGRLDEGFQPMASLPEPPNPEFYDAVHTMLIQPDGTILGGSARWIDLGPLQTAVVRFFPDGTVDSGFNAEESFPSAGIFVSSMALQPDGKIVLALVPVTDVATEQPRISPLVIRLQSDGTRDESFYPGEGVLLEEIDEAEAQKVAFHQDGTLLVGGQFFTVNGVSRVCLARLHGTSVETLVIPPKPRLRISIQDGEVAVHWQRVFGPCGVLEEAERIEGPWKPVVNPVDPFVVAPAAAAGFYRIIESASP